MNLFIEGVGAARAVGATAFNEHIWSLIAIVCRKGEGGRSERVPAEKRVGAGVGKNEGDIVKKKK